jgi:uncharacterized membrane protein
MVFLVIGLVLFLGVHSTAIVAPQWRDGMIARLGAQKWKGLYSIVAVVGLVLLIYGYGEARQRPVLLYAPPLWTRHATALLMLPVFSMLIATYFPGRIQTALKHPMLAAVKLWAFAHLLSNGMLADVLLFGGFLVWAVADRISLKRRPPQKIPQAAAPSWRNDAIVIVGGLVFYVIFALWLHIRLIGVPVMPVALS